MNKELPIEKCPFTGFPCLCDDYRDCSIAESKKIPTSSNPTLYRKDIEKCPRWDERKFAISTGLIHHFIRKIS